MRRASLLIGKVAPYILLAEKGLPASGREFFIIP
jgi:hypothetical protein